jgi:hypothetical protein
MSSRFQRSAAVVLAVAAGVAIAACGGSSPAGSKTADQVMPAVQSAVKAAKSVHMTGSVIQGSQKLTMDLSFNSPSGVAGTIGVNGAHFFLLSLGGKTYIKLNASFLKYAKAPASACATICGKYVELPAASATQITGSLSLNALAQQAFGKKIVASAKGSGAVFSPATVNGQAVLQCRQGAYTLDVAAQGKPYPALFTGPHGEDISFSGWNSTTLPGPPPASDVISLGSLG